MDAQPQTFDKPSREKLEFSVFIFQFREGPRGKTLPAPATHTQPAIIFGKEIKTVKKVGILVGREQTFPVSLINSVNERGGGEVVAEFVKIGGVRHDGGKEYDLIVDRISHQVPFYRAYLKRAALAGTIIINNPFWWSADDKFFNYSLAEKLGVAVPRTVLLPQKDYMEDITGESLRNLEFPLDWQGIADYVGFPAYIKPFDGGGYRMLSLLEPRRTCPRRFKHMLSLPCDR